MTSTDEAHEKAREIVPAESVWWGWGPAEAHDPLPDSTRLLLARLGIPARPRPPVPLAEVRLPASRLPDPARAALAEVVGDDEVRVDDVTRIRHCRGRSTTDLLHLRAGDASAAPDAVVRPADHDEVLGVLRVATREHLVVVPFGGGTSVVGGLAPPERGDRAAVALDLARLDRLGRVDPDSGTAELGAGLRGPRAEALLAEHGLTLGHVPQSWEYATIGGYAATRSSGQASGGYGRFDDLVVGLRVATPVGGWELGRAPASAAGPDLRELLLGSEGAFGVITQVVVRVRPLPARRGYEAWSVPDFATGIRLLRSLAARDLRPTVCRLSDETETVAGLARPTRSGGERGGGVVGCYLVTGYEGDDRAVEQRSAAVAAVLLAGGAKRLGAAAGQDWEQGRFRAPYLRDALLDQGIFAETLETAGFWTALPGLYAAVRDALTMTLAAAGLAPVVMCHISHLYATGASLYFTVVCGEGDDPIGSWRAAKAAATDAVVATGGTITHHHAVGTEHRPWLGAEIGDLGVEVLRAVKRTLDPAGILNPGVLVA
ncbi:FAD-binding oxidoreductase [Frankia sp. CcWB3]